MLQAEKFSTRDLILLGVFNAMLLLFYFGTVLALHLFPFLWGAIDPIVNFVLAPIFIVMLAKVPKVGAMSIHGLIVGLVHMMMGWWPGLIAGLIAGLAADGVAAALGGYARKRVIYVGVLVFVSLKAFIFYAPLYLLTRMAWFQETLSMWPQEYIDKYTFIYALGFLGMNLIACSLGLLLGTRLMKKHFGSEAWN